MPSEITPCKNKKTPNSKRIKVLIGGFLNFIGYNNRTTIANNSTCTILAGIKSIQKISSTYNIDNKRILSSSNLVIITLLRCNHITNFLDTISFRQKLIHTPQRIITNPAALFATTVLPVHFFIILFISIMAIFA